MKSRSVRHQRGRTTMFRPCLEVLESRELLSAGGLDLGFGTQGLVHTDFGDADVGNAVALQSDGKIVVAGQTFTGGGLSNFAVARYNPDGKLDTTFSLDGKVATDFFGELDTANAVAIQTDGKIVAAGSASVGGSDIVALARYNTDGSLDTSFGTNGKFVNIFLFGGVIHAVAIQDGKIVVAGSRITDGHLDAFLLERFNSNGTLDPGFGTSGKVVTDFGSSDDVGRAMAIQANGQIVVAGSTAGDVALVRYNTNGSLDTGFGTNGKVVTHVANTLAKAHAIALQDDGRVVVAGNAGTAFLLGRYLPSGTLDSDFDADGLVTTNFGNSVAGARGVVVQPDGKIIAAGVINISIALVRCNPDGGLDPTFGTAGTVTTSLNQTELVAEAVALQADGKLVAVGSVNPLGSSVDFEVARYITNSHSFRTSRLGALLTIRGTQNADQIDVADDGAGNITISSGPDDTAPVHISGIHQVTLEMLGGDDVVHYRVGSSTSIGGPDIGPGGPGERIPATFQLVDVTINLGSGNDELTFNSQFAAQAYTATGGSTISVAGGDGKESVAITLGGSQTIRELLVDLGNDDDTFTLYARLLAMGDGGVLPPNWRIDAGAGDDLLSVDVRLLLPAVRPPSLSIGLGAGNDTLNFNGGDFAPDDYAARPPINWRVVIDANTGNDRVMARVQGAILMSSTISLGDGNDVAWYDAFPPAARDLTIDGGLGDDAILVTQSYQVGLGSPEVGASPKSRVNIFDNDGSNDITVIDTFNPLLELPGTSGVFSTALATTIHTGGSRNNISVIYAIPGTSGSRNVIMAAPMTLDVNSGGGSDRILTSVGGHSLSSAPGGCDSFIFNANVSVSILSGAGNDTVTVMLGDASCSVANAAPILNSSFRLVADGEDGNDVIFADLRFADGSQGRLDARILGGRGNDTLTLDVFYPDANNLSALLDGDEGFDTSLATDNVRVRNTELMLGVAGLDNQGTGIPNDGDTSSTSCGCSSMSDTSAGTGFDNQDVEGHGFGNWLSRSIKNLLAWRRSSPGAPR